jgi:hypothetical protein
MADACVFFFAERIKVFFKQTKTANLYFLDFSKIILGNVMCKLVDIVQEVRSICSYYNQFYALTPCEYNFQLNGNTPTLTT